MFTSRLPMSTSVRRPKSMAEGSAGLANSLNRPSAIPISVKKANLFTPQTNKRPFSFTNSTAGKSSFRSSVATTDRKSYSARPTAKPMPDRDQQVRMFDDVVEFLKMYGYPHVLPEPKKFFSSVSTTESARIFEFMITQIWPDFKIGRLELDVPEALKILGYPNIRAVTKSALVSVTTRQAVVVLLSIFHWLAYVVHDMNGPDIQSDTSDSLPLTAQILNIFQNTPSQQLPEAQKKLFEDLYPPPEIENLEQSCQRLDSELEAISEEIGEITQANQLNELLEEDLLKCKRYHDEMTQYIEGKNIEITKAQSEELRLKSIQEELTSRIDQIRQESKANIDSEEAKRMSDECYQLEYTLKKLKTQNTEREKNLQEEVSAKIEERKRQVQTSRAQAAMNMEATKRIIDNLKVQRDTDKPNSERLIRAREKLLLEKKATSSKATKEREARISLVINNHKENMIKMMSTLKAKAAVVDRANNLSVDRFERGMKSMRKLNEILTS